MSSFTTPTADLAKMLRTGSSKISTGRSGSDHLDVEITVISPALAAAMLDKNVHNRKVSPALVTKLAQDMTEGRWGLTGEAVKFDTQGNLIDGQHRLRACVKADKSFETLVIYNVQTEMQKKMDGGKSRSVADILMIDGHHYTSVLVGALRFILAEKYRTSPNSASWSNGTLLDAFERHSQLPASVRRVCSKKLPRGVTVSYISAIHYLASRYLDAPSVAGAFVDVMHTGIPDYAGCAAHSYRERIIREQPLTVRTGKDARWKFVKKSWNAFAHKRPVKMYKVMPKEEVWIEGVIPGDL